MFGRVLKAAIVCGVAGAAWGCIAPVQARVMQATYAPVGGQTLVPYGWVKFCGRYRGECDTRALQPMDVNLTPASYRKLKRVNLWVNEHVKPITDMDHWGVIDQWDYPIDGYGDCEDYALLKRKLLMQAGFPRQGLLITVVKDTHGEGHAILTVKTNHGEFILDNLTDRIKPWTQTGYRFVKRQSQSDPNVWLDIGQPSEAPLVVSR
ncbi:MAG TPA: transglutaminase-like cysteine peptidase [Beijerinckiaceae bacterium]|nr:transglutaminase-like cysteine peptidase [Beijerinckiaceae bacterium]